MENTWKKLREYAARVRETFFELNRDPYMVLVECGFIRRSLSREDDLTETSKLGIERSLRDLESQATFDWNEKGYSPV